MKKIFIISISLLFLFFSCTTKAPVEQNPVTPEEEVLEDEIIEDEIIEETVEDVYEYIDDDLVEDVDEIIITDEQAEYLRSIDEIAEEDVSFDEFAEDKAAILQIIEELSDIMQRYDFAKWKKYISKASLDYYSNTANLRKAQKKLPDKTISLKGPNDYFKHVFIPSRMLSKVDEIRYISKTDVKAVEVREDDQVVVYYYFVKENDKWMVRLPEIE